MATSMENILRTMLRKSFQFPHIIQTMNKLCAHRKVGNVLKPINGYRVLSTNVWNNSLSKSIAHSVTGRSRASAVSFESLLCGNRTMKMQNYSGSLGDRQMCYESRDVNFNTSKTLYFDTLALVKQLQKRGFSVEQSEAITDALIQIVNTYIDQQQRMMVSKGQQEIMMQQIMSQIASVKKDMIILEKSEFSALRNDTEKQTIEIKQLKDSINDHISRLKGQMTLDINLERSRAIEAQADHNNTLAKVSNKIDMEVANLRTTYEQYRNDVLKYAAATFLSCLTICLGFFRIWK